MMRPRFKDFHKEITSKISQAKRADVVSWYIRNHAHTHRNGAYGGNQVIESPQPLTIDQMASQVSGWGIWNKETAASIEANTKAAK